MGVPKFNFRRDESTRGSPRLAPWKGSIQHNFGWLFYAVAGLLLGLLIAALIQRYMRRRRKRTHHTHGWDRIQSIGLQKGLTEVELRMLVGAVREVGASRPDQAAEDHSYFDTLIAPELIRRVGGSAAEGIRHKLFPEEGAKKEPESPAFGGTRNLTPGQKVRLHFSGVSGTFPCTVINVTDHGFIVTLPASEGRHIHPQKDDMVEGYIERGSSLCSFESRVVETFRGGVFACRIAHAANLKETHKRRSVRVPIKRKVVFGHFPAANVEDGEVPLQVLQSRLSERWDGVLRDLSVGGCALATPAEVNFEVGDFVQFSLRILEDDPPHTFFGTLAHVSPVPASEGGGRILHVQFLGLDEDAEAVLTRAIHRLRAAPSADSIDGPDA